LSLLPNNYTTNLCREKPSKYPTVEQALALWIDQVVDGNCSLSGHTVIQKAATFAQRLGIQNFRGSNGWFDRFKKRYGVRNYLRHGEANSAPLEDLQQHRTELTSKIFWLHGISKMFIIVTRQLFFGNLNLREPLLVNQFQV